LQAAWLFGSWDRTAVQSPTGALTIRHDDIAGFMPAMEMMYKVKSPDLAKEVHPGDAIDFKIDAAKTKSSK